MKTPTAKIRWSTAPSPSLAATYGNIPTTSIVATRRPDYLKAFLNHLVNWDYVAERYEAAMK
jgi:superoxide dismutase, Fe-Mn family